MGAAGVAAGASLRKPVEWHSINWKKAHRNVRRLQARIVKALKAGQKRKVRALQFILARSLSQSGGRQASDNQPRQADAWRGW